MLPLVVVLGRAVLPVFGLLLTVGLELVVGLEPVEAREPESGLATLAIEVPRPLPGVAPL